ncbi:MAG: HTH domain-containing protein [Deltaproteobacteria bacterium]|nr:HTH domain-containing protein [Deltaproteobacteria bacterium]
MRGDQFTRQWKILLTLLEKKSGQTVQDLAELLGVSVRTVYRDLEVLDRAGVPLVQEREGRNVRWRVMNLNFSGLTRGLSLQLTPAEVEALCSCVDHQAEQRCPNRLSLRSLARKVAATLPPELTGSLRVKLGGEGV